MAREKRVRDEVSLLFKSVRLLTLGRESGRALLPRGVVGVVPNGASPVGWIVRRAQGQLATFRLVLPNVRLGDWWAIRRIGLLCHGAEISC